MFLDILNRYFKGFYVPKNTFFEGTKKIFLCKNFFGTFCTCTKVACAKKTLRQAVKFSENYNIFASI